MTREILIAESDNDAIAVASADGRRLLRTVPLAGGPEQVVVGPGGAAYVSLRRSGEVALLAPGTRQLAALVAVGHEPYGLALGPDGHTLFVSLAGDGEVVGLDAATLAELLRVPVDRDPRGLAVLPDENKLFVTHLTGRSVTLVDVPRIAYLRASPNGTLWANALRPVRRIPLANEIHGRLPNLAFAIAPSPDGHRLFVPHVTADTGQSIDPARRASTYGGGAPDPISSTIDTIDVADERARANPVADVRTRRVFGPCLPTISQPRAITIDSRQGRVFVAGFGSDDVTAFALEDAAWLGEQRLCIRLARGSGPKGLALSSDGARLYVHASLDHKLETIELAGAATRADTLRHARLSLGPERLPAAAVRGRRIFFSAGDDRQSTGGRFPCASCHPEGRQDGLVWRLDDGPRQTPLLAGRLVGTAPYNWRGTGDTLRTNMTETMHRLGGKGLPAKDLADLELFLTRHLEPPPAAPQAPDALVARGKALFQSDDVGCAHCHDPSRRFTDGKQHDVGSINPEEVRKLGSFLDSSLPRRSYNTPSLIGVARTAPYFHDGSIASLRDLLTVANPGDRMGRTADLAPREIDALVAYLTTL